MKIVETNSDKRMRIQWMLGDPVQASTKNTSRKGYTGSDRDRDRLPNLVATVEVAHI